MVPISFREQTVILAEDQYEYLNLPAYTDETHVISCWGMSWSERLRILFTGKLWLRQLTFGNPLQPQLPTTEYPFES